VNVRICDSVHLRSSVAANVAHGRQTRSATVVMPPAQASGNDLEGAAVSAVGSVKPEDTTTADLCAHALLSARTQKLVRQSVTSLTRAMTSSKDAHPLVLPTLLPMRISRPRISFTR
jgi:hypothetical protein